MNLTALQHSPFLQSLGWAIANSLWQAAALWICYYLITGTYKNATAKLKTNSANILLSLSFVWFCYTLFDKYFSLLSKINEASTQVYHSSYITTITFASTQWQLVLNKAASALPYLSVAYLLLLIFLSIKLINSYRYINFVKLNGLQKPDAEWKLFTERVARHIGISRKIKLWVSHHIDVPATIGFLKPVILIPVASINQLSPSQLEAIILHELSHIKRNDYLINIFISLAETILFFNPFIVLLAKIIKRERENCCDDFVIQYQYDRHSYASALLSLEQTRNMSLRLAISATSGKKQLLHRVKRIMEVKNNAGFNYGQKLLALLLITGVFCSVAWLSPASSEKTHVLAKTINASPKIIRKYKSSFETKSAKINLPSIALAKVEKAQPEQTESVKTTPVTKQKNIFFDEENVQQAANNIDKDNIKLSTPEIETPDVPFNTTASTTLKKLPYINFTNQSSAASFQKLEALIQNKKYLPSEIFQNEIKKAMADVQKNLSETNVLKYFKPEEIVRLLSADGNNATAKTFFRVPAHSLRINKTPNNTICVTDSIVSKRMVFLNHRINTASASSVNVFPSEERRVKRGTPAAPHEPEFAFNYTAPTAVYRSASPEVSNLRKLNLDKDTHIEYSNGVLTVNGKTVRVNGFNNANDKNVAQVKNKKLSIVSGENIIEINLND